MSRPISYRSTAKIIDPYLCLGLVLIAVVAWLRPFDRLFAAATFGWPALRAALIVFLALLGGQMARFAGLRITSQAGEKHAVLAPVLAATCVALFCTGVDGIFRPVLSPTYLDLMTQVSWQVRTLVNAAHAFNEEILYRLFLGSLFACGLVMSRKRGGHDTSATMLMLAFALAQGVAVCVDVLCVSPVNGLTLTYDFLRFFAPGMVWAWLYVKRSFVAAEFGHITAHPIFQPLVGVMLRH